MSNYMNDEHGCSRCKNGEERYEEYKWGFGRKTRTSVQYDYRTEDGELFSCVASTLADCRAKKDEWLAKKVG